MEHRLLLICIAVVCTGCSVERAGLAGSGDDASLDFGVPLQDLGGPALDLGASIDMGAPPVDIGVPPPTDMGTPPVDLGPAVCSILSCPGRRCTAGACDLWRSCAEIHAADGAMTSPTGTYPIDPDGPGGMPWFMAFCEMSADDGGWTLVLKVNGTDATTFSYYQGIWTDGTTLAPTSLDYSRTQAKLQAYFDVPANELRIGFLVAGGSGDGVSATYGVFNPPDKPGFQRLITDGAAALGADTDWLALVAGSDVQHHFRATGVNSLGHLRIGLLGDESTMMSRSPDSFLGIGPDSSFGASLSAGNWTRFNDGGSDRTTPCWAFVFVR